MCCIRAEALQRLSIEKAAHNRVTAAASKREAHFIICQGRIFSSRQRSSMPSRESGIMCRSISISKMAFIQSLNARVMIKRGLNKCNKLDLLSQIQLMVLSKAMKMLYAHEPILASFSFWQEIFRLPQECHFKLVQPCRKVFTINATHSNLWPLSMC